MTYSFDMEVDSPTTCHECLYVLAKRRPDGRDHWWCGGWRSWTEHDLGALPVGRSPKPKEWCVRKPENDAIWRLG